MNRSVISILKTHRFVRQVINSELSVKDTFPILQALSNLDELGPARVDIGKLAVRFKESGQGSVEEFVRQEVAPVLGTRSDKDDQHKDIVLYGFGRIGRLLARILIEKSGNPGSPRLRAIVVRSGGEGDLAKRASLLRRDSVHGSFQGTILLDEDNNAIIANGNHIPVIYSDGPDQIDYTQYGIEDAIVVDNTGKWRDEEGLGLHLKAPGVSRVILTAPGKGNIKNIVYGINHDEITEDDKIISAASCTTNAIVPVLKVVNDEYGLDYGHVETVHAYTNDQNLIDNNHKKHRRGRSAALNMVITETGAAKAVAKALPELAGKLTGNAIRVPTPNVSLAILNLTLGRDTSVEELNGFIRDVALHSPMQKQIDFTNSPEVVSCDLVGSRFAGVVDGESTIVENNHAVLYVWYDNEFGYSCQVVRIMQLLAGVNYMSIPSSAQTEHA